MEIKIIAKQGLCNITKSYKEGTSYFSYGRIYFKPSTTRLYGRIHFDQSNSFELSNETGGGLSGLYEISRICRMPLHTA